MGGPVFERRVGAVHESEGDNKTDKMDLLRRQKFVKLQEILYNL